MSRDEAMRIALAILRNRVSELEGEIGHLEAMLGVQQRNAMGLAGTRYDGMVEGLMVAPANQLARYRLERDKATEAIEALT